MAESCLKKQQTNLLYRVFRLNMLLTLNSTGATGCKWHRWRPSSLMPLLALQLQLLLLLFLLTSQVIKVVLNWASGVQLHLRGIKNGFFHVPRGCTSNHFCSWNLNLFQVPSLRIRVRRQLWCVRFLHSSWLLAYLLRCVGVHRQLYVIRFLFRFVRAVGVAQKVSRHLLDDQRALWIVVHWFNVGSRLNVQLIHVLRVWRRLGVHLLIDRKRKVVYHDTRSIHSIGVYISYLRRANLRHPCIWRLEDFFWAKQGRCGRSVLLIGD